MERLNYNTLKSQEYSGFYLESAPEKVLQFGEGGFLRAFIDYFFDIMNEKGGFNGKVVISQPRGGHPEVSRKFAEQDGLYTLILRGRENGKKVFRKRVISSVSRCLDPKSDWEQLLACAENPALRFIVSNTTEAGIAYDPKCTLNDAPPSSYPAKLLAFLYRRYKLNLPGFWILPCELNDHNGDLLLTCLRKYMDDWKMEEGFIKWFNEENRVCSTLVDRIVTGYPRDPQERQGLWEKLGYEDRLLDTGEPFALWVIESPRDLSGELPFPACGLPVIYTDNQKPYKQRKVRILNGAHTSFVPAAFQCGHDIVLEAMGDPLIRSFMQKTLYEEVIPTLDLPRDDLMSFAEAVTGRFENPFIKHALLAICLNSVSKWRARCMPSLLIYVEKNGKLPPRLTFSLASLMALYHGGKLEGGKLVCLRGDEPYTLQDDPAVLAFFAEGNGKPADELVREFLSNTDFFGQDLTAVPGLYESVLASYNEILEKGMRAAMTAHFGG